MRAWLSGMAVMLALIAGPGAGPASGQAAVEPPIMSFPSPEANRGGFRRPRPQAREQVVAGLSSDEVSITASFDGSDIILYGAVRRETPVQMNSLLHVVATVEGPPRSVTIRRKERKLGIWVNTESVVVGSAPSFYSVASTAPLDLILNREVDARYRISIPMAMRAFARPFSVENPTDFTEAMIVSRIADGSYRLDEGAVRLARDTLFRADFRLPANLIEGDYKIRIFLLRNGRVVDSYSAPLDVRKVGVERWLHRLAFERPLLYGLLSLLIAVAAGWGASAAFRVLQRK
ncbi:conserved hypothetical protein [Paracoccus isoporae]|uniref:Transmembrane protein n=1 Tax=Paracoccus isoporae TaxID=591205 RepID=A0A1G7F623_9RHOB|nr:TIGR02186 family protein [Paracoccus isoporae]SDE71373.1 conserved hypothetical protein [Paracoccus isoporae]